jgi:hypothetical protein
MLYRNTRRRRNRRATKRSRRHGRRSRRLHFFKVFHKNRKQNGGGYAYEIPANAIVIRRSLDDDMASPPTVMTKEQMDEQVENAERA